MLGTFFINDIFGYQRLSTGDVMETFYFSYDTKNWLPTIFKDSIRIGSRISSHFSNKQEFSGEISCLQIYSNEISLAQAKHRQNCPVRNFNYGKFKPCPTGYIYHRKNCYLVSKSKASYSAAEVACLSPKG